MEDAITWSYDLLDDGQRAFLGGLSLFAGPFTVQAAEAVCGSSAARRMLHDLVAQSMVTFVPGNPVSRFRLLEPIRQFARRQLDENRFLTLEERHANWFAKRAVALADAMRGAGEIEAAEALTTEWSDLGRALAWGREHGRSDIAVEPLLAFEIQLVWQTRFEAFRWLEAGVEACELPENIKAKADVTRAMGAWCAGDTDLADAHLSSSESLGGDAFEICFMRFCVHFVREDYSSSVECGRRLLDIASRSTNPKQCVMAPAFLACSLGLCYGETEEIPNLLKQVETELARHPWPSGRCCELLAHVVTSFGRGAHTDFARNRQELEKAVGRCYAYWFTFAAAGMETSQDTLGKTEVFAELKNYVNAFSSANLSGDLILIPGILRAIVIFLVDLEQDDLAAKLCGLVPKIKGIGAKGTLTPGYEDAVSKLKESLNDERFAELIAEGHRWELVDAVDPLETLVAE